MGSSYFGEPSLGNGRSGSSRKGKKTNSDKPKQPQRGLGVAQLEKIRLHNEMSCSYLPSLHNPYHTSLNQEEEVRLGSTYSSVPSSSSFPYSSSSAAFGFHTNIMMGLGDMEATDFRYGESQSSISARWNNSNGISETQYSVHPTETRHLLSLNVEDSLQKKGRKDRYLWDSIGSSSQNSDSSDVGEIDLELKL